MCRARGSIVTNTVSILSPSLPRVLRICCQLGHGRRADVGALGVAEEDDQHLALPVGQRPELPVDIGQLERAREFGAGDVGRMEDPQRAAGALAGGERRGDHQGAGEPPAAWDVHAMSGQR